MLRSVSLSMISRRQLRMSSASSPHLGHPHGLNSAGHQCNLIIQGQGTTNLCYLGELLIALLTEKPPSTAGRVLPSWSSVQPQPRCPGTVAKATDSSYVHRNPFSASAYIIIGNSWHSSLWCDWFPLASKY